MNVDFVFGFINEQEVRDLDTDYSDSNELRSLDSDDEEEEEGPSQKRIRREVFNPRIDMEDLIFKVGQIFESKKVLKDAITEHLVRHNREIKYLKNDAKRLRATCKQICSWILYATKQEDKLSFEIKTFKGGHNCSMVYKNRRVTPTYLAGKYASDFRVEPNMTFGGFMDKVKKANLGDISIWQFYRTREKAMEKIRGSVVEHYRVLVDYYQQLRLTNVGSTIQLEGRAGEFKRLYICLGGLKEGFINGCGRVIGMDGCFLKTEHGGQLLTAVGVDGNNIMYPVAYAMVETENGENWSWFLTLLRDDLRIHDSHGWTFISDKQKGLVNAIGSLFEHPEHRTCIRHLYNNFSATHKGSALKNCLWDAARATTIPKWLEHLQKMLDLDPAAYGWLELKPASQWTKSHFQEETRCDMLLNNLCESFNSTLLNAREHPILTMLEEIRVYLMKSIVIRREACEKWNGEIGPRIQKILNKNGELTRREYADYSDNGKFQVRHNIGTLNAVDIKAKTCSCRV
ncbi:uncharacterized protein LOC111412677 [Olea europaea var. sylvestris]|uniref:uncharacterized protein LOC111412677 n=1 Tax=Olea europaea var. sylvestris TaxID=158386 RepID=UPI000C1D245E|nr:uncharacterized protein LOC111412677 [Olea europaea var. sylvestris]